ncbi:MAG: hypothetical protein NDJ75_06780, partial [Thermoanaerobaculia bacterium]|nr:hypothetical protein [Thermoanaerobaculia bacterium]
MHGTRLRWTVATAAALLGGLAAPFAAQNAPTVIDRVDVRLVEVDAWAHDGGRPVLDLRADELRLFEDGKPVEILFFTPPRSAEAPPPAVVEAGRRQPPSPSWRSEADSRDNLVIFFDDAHLAPANRSRVVAALAAWFERRDNAGADVTVARYEQELEVLLPRTSDVVRVAPLLRSLGAAGMRAVEASLDERRTLDVIRQIQRRGIDDMENAPGARALLRSGNEPPPASVEPVGLPCSKEMLRQADDWADRAERSSRETLAALQAYAGSLAALPGRKILLFVSDGIPSRPGGPAYDLIRTLCDGSGAAQGIQDASDVSSQPAYLIKSGQLDRATLAVAGETRSLGGRFAEIAAQANASGVAVWTYSAR